MLEGIVQFIVSGLQVVFNVISWVSDFLTNNLNIARDFSLVITSAIFAFLVARPSVIQNMLTVGVFIFLLVLFIISGGIT